MIQKCSYSLSSKKIYLLSEKSDFNENLYTCMDHNELYVKQFIFLVLFNCNYLDNYVRIFARNSLIDQDHLETLNVALNILPRE